ncbi:MAG TPA: sulfatase-like hydrolase/transferase [Thermoanaerobaculia bacterium]
MNGSRLKAALLLPVLVLACRQEPGRPPVILLSIDTLRADRLARMPNLQRLAADAITFESAWTPVPLTLPAHASLFTGLLPPEHGVRDNAGFRLDPKLPTIATILRQRGYATGAAVSAYVLRRDTGIAGGFDFFDDAIEFVEGAPTGALHRRGEITLSRALRWLDRQSEKPPFLFVHLFEPHTPYEPSYDADVLLADRLAGELFDELRARDLYDDALIVVLSDHGEGLGDHGEEEHGILLYREALQVPLLVKLPRNRRKGERVAEAVQLIDVLPTIAEVTGANVRGQSLLEPKPRPIYGETLYPRIHLGWSELRSLVRAPHHLIDGPKPELYRLDTDPREQRDVRAQERRAFSRLREDLATFPQRQAAPQVSAEEAKKLAALGYLTQTATVRSDKNPRDHLHELQARKEVTALLGQGRFDEAAARIEALGWSDLRDDLAFAYERAGRLDDAERTYRQAIRATPELAHEVALSLAGVLLRKGNLDEAARHAGVAAERSTQPKAARLMLAEIQALRRDLTGALQILASIEPPHPPRYHFLLGDVLGSLGRTDEAIAAFEQEVQRAPRDREARRRLELLRHIRSRNRANPPPLP